MNTSASASKNLAQLRTAGELGVKGDNVFKEYWQRPDATTDSFTEDGFFKLIPLPVISHSSSRSFGCCVRFAGKYHPKHSSAKSGLLKMGDLSRRANGLTACPHLDQEDMDSE